ncbi:hypothetical protein ACJIZ3_025442 [Penstemon smallii]|uniref:Rhodanese domain-containing protein n=1 Tax=Penstemon smallii TaxID=265156 RepID=A0ABD3TVZ2_9LAMI
MLPVCSMATSCSCNAQIPVLGALKSFSSYWKALDDNCNNVQKLAHYCSNGVHFGSKGMMNGLIYQSKLSSYQIEVIDKSHQVEPNGIIFVDSSSNSVGDNKLLDFISKTIDIIDILPNADPESTTPFIGLPIDPSDLLNIDANALYGQEIDIADIVIELNDSTADTLYGAENVLSNAFNTFISSLKMALTNANESVNNVINDMISLINKSGESSELKEATGGEGLVALDVLRLAVILFEDSLRQGGKTVGYAYSSVKEFLPVEFQDTLGLSEESVGKVLRPVGSALHQVQIVLERFEESLGLDPNDPLIPFALFLGLSATLWGSYRVLRYSGYAGDLSPQSTMELLRGKGNVVLIDIRPENLRERDGIPDLRRAARFRYASVTLPEVDGSVKKLLKGGRDLENSLLAAVIHNLKIVKDRSKVLVMDADGTRSKGIARSLRKLGIKRPYLVQGGFRSWVEDGFRVKELKPETTLTMLNEEAEAIFEEIKPTPLKLIGYGAGLIAAAYSLLEWEKTLQFVGVIGLAQIIYSRVTSYQDAEDFKQDVRMLLGPVRLGGQAMSWAVGKLEPSSRNVLPTTPSSISSSQPTDLEAPQDEDVM